MTRRRPAGPSTATRKARSAGVATASARPPSCPMRHDRLCAPVNHIAIRSGDDAEVYASCDCGRRFPLSVTAQRNMTSVLADPASQDLPREADTPRARALDAVIASSTWPADRIETLSKRGVVPVGVPVLHRPADPVPLLTPGVDRLALHMLDVMRAADGIGLAANQVGVPLRMFTHSLAKVLPQVVVNPVVVRAFGRWEYREGCLSLELADTHATVQRPRVIIVRGRLLDGRALAVRADELLGRVFQHEIDHLDGIEYVQRLAEPTRSEIYRFIEDSNVDLSCLPPKPYSKLR